MINTSLKESHLATEMAKVLYDFLPGSGAPSWKGHVSFETVSRDVGVGDFWQRSSKEPAIAALLEKTLSRRRELFEKLILSIIKEGLKYRQKEDKPIKRQEIETLNGLILQVGFKFPSLWDEDFLSALETDLHKRANAKIEEVITQEKLKESVNIYRIKELDDLKKDYYHFCSRTDRQKVGLDFEPFLNRLFALFNLEPRPSFRLKGEQIDGSFILDNEIYLVEAKWYKTAVSRRDLAAFRDTVASKSSVTRGAFISVEGVTLEAIEAITRGQSANFFIIDGYDITVVLEGVLTLPDLLRRKLRKLADEGKIFVSGRELTK